MLSQQRQLLCAMENRGIWQSPHSLSGLGDQFTPCFFPSSTSNATQRCLDAAFVRIRDTYGRM